MCRVNHEGITNCLLPEKKLTYEKAIELVQAIESAERDTKQLKAAQATSTHHLCITAVRNTLTTSRRARNSRNLLNLKGVQLYATDVGVLT